MACEGCKRRREWLANWVKVANERLSGRKPTDANEGADSLTESTDRGDKQSS